LPQGLEDAIVNFAQTLYHNIGWVGVVIAMAIESACIPVPSELIMPLAGWFLGQAVGASLLQTMLLGGLFGAIGCLLGSLLAYAVGYYGGRPLITHWGRYILLNEHHLEQAESFFERRGELTAFVSRLLPVIRTFISLPAGIAKMNLTKFSFYTFIGSFIWSAALAGVGYGLGANWSSFRRDWKWLDYPIITIVLLAIIYFIYRQIQGGGVAAARGVDYDAEELKQDSADQPKDEAQSGSKL
jgi:membrane protein DedA with SNARE-associated domain